MGACAFMLLPSVERHLESMRRDEVSIEVIEPPTPEVVEPTPEVEPTAPTTATPPVGTSTSPAPTTTTTPTIEAPGTAVVPDVVELPSTASTPTISPEDAQRERQRLAALIDPRAAAASAFVIEGPGPTQRGAAAGLGSGSRGLPGLRAEAEVEAELTGSLREQAMTKAYLTRTRPRVVPHPDGTHTYTGHAFTATIERDGTVRFSDRGAVEADLATGSGSFDVTDMFMRGAGQDPYAAEREWFMEQTETLRERLEAEHRTTTLRRGLGDIRDRLRRAWANEAETPVVRRRRIFDMWDELDDGSESDDARAAIMTFIREHLPDGSADAYLPGELTRLNARRESGHAFRPY